MKFKKILSMSLVLSMALLAGCSKEEKSYSDISVGLVVAEGHIDDEGRNKEIWRGLKRAKEELGVEISYEEPKEEDYVTTLEKLIGEETDLIVCVGEPIKESLKEVANAYTDKQFAIVDEVYDIPVGNIAQVTFKEEEGAYLAGALAAKITETNSIGFIGDMPDKITDRYKYGFKAGLESINPKIKLEDKYTNTEWDKSIEGQIAKDMYATDIDIIFSVAGNAGAEAIKAAKEANKLAIGVDENRRELAPDNLLTSVLKKYNIAIFNVVKDFGDGNLKFGEVNRYGLESGAISLSDGLSKHVSEEVSESINEISEEIQKGEDSDIKIPKTEHEYNNINKVEFK